MLRILYSLPFIFPITLLVTYIFPSGRSIGVWSSEKNEGAASKKISERPNQTEGRNEAGGTPGSVLLWAAKLAVS